MHIKGVNLGNWLVLEKWMSPALFEGTEAEDEYYLPRQLSREVYEARIRIHRSEYITEQDACNPLHGYGSCADSCPVLHIWRQGALHRLCGGAGQGIQVGGAVS